ncbi:MAG TPA: hypothetical protein VFV38_21275 [Ktedonobacteraceae bacterium]|nr:hypothetical protein [Ktedonobacteraceae bacterium]
MSIAAQSQHQQTSITAKVLPPLPFIFRYLAVATPLQFPACTDMTAGYETKYETNWDSQSSTDYTDDADETDADAETGVLADSNSKEDEE